MKVDCSIVQNMHLDPGYALLSVQNCFTAMEMFTILDVHGASRLNDVQFLLLMKNITNLSRYEVEIIFNLLDIDHSGEIEFDEFYLVFCILIASKDSYEKEFIYRHSRCIFQLIDSDGSGEISSEEFGHMGILFNFDATAIHRIFNEFDVSGDKNLDFAEFRLFTMACIDEARAQDARTKVQAFESYHKRLIHALEPLLRRFIRTDCLPLPRDVEEMTHKVKDPFKPGYLDWKMPFQAEVLKDRFHKRRDQLRNWVKTLLQKYKSMYCCCWFICCDFCCLDHPDDKFSWSCKCNCWCAKCWTGYLMRRVFHNCLCCCDECYKDCIEDDEFGMKNKPSKHTGVQPDTVVNQNQDADGDAAVTVAAPHTVTVARHNTMMQNLVEKTTSSPIPTIKRKSYNKPMKAKPKRKRCTIL